MVVTSALLAGKVAVVTGAGRGVGRGVALKLARAGAAVVVNDLGVALSGAATGETPADSVVREIQSFGGRAQADRHDVSDFSTAAGIVESAVCIRPHRHRGLQRRQPVRRDLPSHDRGEFDDVLRVHLKGSFNVSRAAAAHFKSQGSGCFVHVTSTSGLVGNFGQANYSAAKLGIVGLSKAIALDMPNSACAPTRWRRSPGPAG